MVALIISYFSGMGLCTLHKYCVSYLLDYLQLFTAYTGLPVKNETAKTTANSSTNESKIRFLPQIKKFNDLIMSRIIE